MSELNDRYNAEAASVQPIEGQYPWVDQHAVVSLDKSLEDDLLPQRTAAELATRLDRSDKMAKSVVAKQIPTNNNDYSDSQI